MDAVPNIIEIYNKHTKQSSTKANFILKSLENAGGIQTSNKEYNMDFTKVSLSAILNTTVDIHNCSARTVYVTGKNGYQAALDTGYAVMVKNGEVRLNDVYEI
jgi:hypothetical protein